MKNGIVEILLKAENGNISNLDAFLELNELSKIIDDAKEQIKKDAYDEVDRIGEKNYEHKGWVINTKSKITWDFKHIKAWVDQKSTLSNIEELAKLAATKRVDMCDTETSEAIEPAIAKYSYFLDIKPVK
jgi:hypothetical protein